MLTSIALVLFLQSLGAPTQAPPIVRVAVQGENNLVPNFIAAFKSESRDLGIVVDVVNRGDAALDYNIVIAQESTVGSAAAAIVALSPAGDLVMSVVRSGRFSGHGAINACAKELAKNIAVFKR